MEVVVKGNGDICRFNEDIRLNSRLASLQVNTRERNSLEEPSWCQNKYQTLMSGNIPSKEPKFDWIAL